MTDTSTGETAPKKSKRDDDKVVTLEDLCKEMKLDGMAARRYLRKAGVRHTAGKPWRWEKGSAALKEAKAVLTK
jgi:hypothetical protein